jgi:hypothetical protein
LGIFVVLVEEEVSVRNRIVMLSVEMIVMVGNCIVCEIVESLNTKMEVEALIVCFEKVGVIGVVRAIDCYLHFRCEVLLLVVSVVIVGMVEGEVEVMMEFGLLLVK